MCGVKETTYGSLGQTGEQDYWEPTVVLVSLAWTRQTAAAWGACSEVIRIS
jgi:hypothetical protein